MKLALSIIFLVFFETLSIGQRIGVTDINPSDISSWNANFKVEYQGSYHFGESEMESQLLIIVSEDVVVAQIRTSDFNDDGTAMVWSYENLKGVRIEGNLFYSEKTNGAFVKYQGREELLHGLKLDKPWNAIDDQYEVGIRINSIQKAFVGLYPEASKKILHDQELRSLSTDELKIMRNEIFARYGYQFRTGGKMNSYFKQQTWYEAQHKDVNKFLTAIEKYNIKQIQSFEK